MDGPAVQQVRRFNRTVAERIGALDDRFLGRPRPMGEARTLWEIEPEGTDVRALRARLAIDSGYMSRLLRSLERQGSVTVGTSRGDRRIRRVMFTEAGQAERAELDRRSDQVAFGILEPLNHGQRAELLAAMNAVERLLDFIDGAHRCGGADVDRRPLVHRAVLRRARRPLRCGLRSVAQHFSRRAPSCAHPAGALLLARLRGEPIGCGALKFHSGKPAEVKRMWSPRPRVGWDSGVGSCGHWKVLRWTTA